jgi:carbonic anhydrase
MNSLFRTFFPLAVMLAAMAAQAGDWEKVVGDHGRMVEIDPGGIFSSDHDTKVSWGRLVLSSDEAARAGYRTIKALNRYDCLNRSFLTIKRVYLDDASNVVREETIPDQTPVLVRRNSVDERLWRKVCGLSGPDSPATKSNGENRAGRIDQIAAAAGRAAKAASTPEASGGQPAASPALSDANLDARVKAAPPKAMPIPASMAAVDAAPEKAAITEAAAQPASPPLVSPARFEATPAAAPMSPPPVMTLAARAKTVHPAEANVSSGPEPLTLPPRPARRGAAEHLPMAIGGDGWNYSGAGAPEFWGQLRPEWKICGEGARQSPIDFAASAPVAVDLEPVRFDYRPSRFRITNAEQQLRVKVDDSMGMEVRGQRYALAGFVLHRPGETRIDGKAADMEAQFIHRDGEGRVAVLAVQLTRGDKPNALLQALLNNLPLEKGSSYMPEVTIDLGAFLPASPAHFLYMGSLTAPPCTEGVLWVVMKEAVTLSDEQFGIFSRLHANNARPPQAVNARLVLESR